MTPNHASTPKRRAALYCRVSDDRQHLAAQRAEVAQLARTRGLDVTVIYEEKKQRDQFDRMRTDAHAGRFDVLVVRALDQLPQSVAGAMQTILDLDRLGVDVLSVREPWLDTRGPVRSLLIELCGYVVERDRLRKSDRVKSVLARMRAAGRQIGRPPVIVNIEHALRLRSDGLSIRKAARVLGVGAATLHRVFQAHDALLRSAPCGVAARPSVAAIGTPKNIGSHQPRPALGRAPDDVTRRERAEQVGT
jgi:putative DNA-invertase from lambdoid prophage Rac